MNNLQLKIINVHINYNFKIKYIFQLLTKLIDLFYKI
jgi:hypothetical protein